VEQLVENDEADEPGGNAGVIEDWMDPSRWRVAAQAAETKGAAGRASWPPPPLYANDGGVEVRCERQNPSILGLAKPM
jgi:hypothetical protein